MAFGYTAVRVIMELLSHTMDFTRRGSIKSDVYIKV